MSETGSRRHILQPLITYKSTMLAQNKCYTFKVDSASNKFQIAEEFERLYDAKVLRVNVVTVRTHRKRTKKGHTTKADTKKAYIYSDKELAEIFPKLEV
jgi:large subunit ribosomal protein L23